MLTRLRSIPTHPGVYIFRRGGTPLYIGKAANLKKRLASYFTNAEGLTLKVKRMLGEATRLETIKTASEIEALLKEAELIKKYRPKYNLLMRDDKNYFYVGITRLRQGSGGQAKEEFPRIFITHQPHQKRLETRDQRLARQDRKLVSNLYPLVSRYIGPFTSGTALYAVLKLLRRVFPYCTCKKPHKRRCLNSEIGRCPGYCCTISEIRDQRLEIRSRREYRKNIKNIMAVLTGKRTRLLGRLRREMKEAVKRECYEGAARLRDQIFGLEDVFKHRTVLQEPGTRFSWTAVEPMLRALLRTDHPVERIEGYDISNISGTSATGSMVVFSNGQPDKSQYRKFRIKTVKGISDVDMLKEVLARRLNHPEWPFPQLLVIDGGKPQLNATLKALRRLEIRDQRLEIPIVTALAKREEILYTESGRIIALKRQDPAVLHLFQRIRDESHRFAIAYHHKLRRKNLRN